MATTLHLDPAAARHAQELADRAAEERINEVMSSPHYQGNEALAKTLLGLSGPHRMLAGEIITALSKAPKPAAEPAAPASSQFNVPPRGSNDPSPSAASAFLTPQQVEFERLYQKGAAAAKWLFGKE